MRIGHLYERIFLHMWTRLSSTAPEILPINLYEESVVNNKQTAGSDFNGFNVIHFVQLKWICLDQKQILCRVRDLPGSGVPVITLYILRNWRYFRFNSHITEGTNRNIIPFFNNCKLETLFFSKLKYNASLHGKGSFERVVTRGFQSFLFNLVYVSNNLTWLIVCESYSQVKKCRRPFSTS